MIEDRVKGEGLRGKGQLRKMKDSGVEWIGEIPEEWEVQPLGNFFNERKEKVSDLDFEPLSVTKNGIVKQLDNAAKTKNHNNRKRVCKGDFVINSRSDRKQSCGISPLDGSVSVINIVLYGKVLNPGFTRYLLDNYGFAEEFYRWGTGIVDDLWSTRFDKMKRILLPHPPSEEQQAIADYLDSKVALIDNIIEKTKQSIEDYKKYKQSLITETVTKGLNPDVEMKNSGVEWIGEVPKHWGVVKLKNVTRLRNERNNGSNLLDYVGLENIESQTGRMKLTDKEEKQSIESSSNLFYKGDVLFGKLRPYLAKCVVADFDGQCSTELLIIRSIEGFSQNIYLKYLMLSSKFIDLINSSTYGTKMPRANWTFISDQHIPLPAYEEQQQIAEYLDTKCSQIDRIIDQKKTLINELETYKKSLIYECVTGKRYVG